MVEILGRNSDFDLTGRLNIFSSISETFWLTEDSNSWTLCIVGSWEKYQGYLIARPPIAGAWVFFPACTTDINKVVDTHGDGLDDVLEAENEGATGKMDKYELYSVIRYGINVNITMFWILYKAGCINKLFGSSAVIFSFFIPFVFFSSSSSFSASSLEACPLCTLHGGSSPHHPDRHGHGRPHSWGQ